MAYSPLALMPILLAIMEFEASLTNILPCQLVVRLSEPQFLHVDSSVNILQSLQAAFFLLILLHSGVLLFVLAAIPVFRALLAAW